MADDRPSAHPRIGPPVAMALRVVVVGTFLSIVFVVSGAMKPWQLLAAGERGPSRDIVVRDFPDVELEDDDGYDGQQFYAIAAELPDLHAAARHLDDPRYRLLRIFAPFVASAASAGDATALALLELNIIGAGLVCGGLASLCEQTGRRPSLGWLGLLPVFPGIFLTVVDPLATGLTLVALALVVRERWWWACAVFSLGCLTREGVAAVVAAAAVGVLLERRRLRPPMVIGLSVLPLIVWYVYLAREIGGEIPARWALLAFLNVPLELIALAALCVALGCAAVWGWRSNLPVAGAAAVVTAQIPFFFEDIFLPLGITRVTAPALCLGLVVAVDWWLFGRERAVGTMDHTSRRSYVRPII